MNIAPPMMFVPALAMDWMWTVSGKAFLRWKSTAMPMASTDTGAKASTVCPIFRQR